LKPDLITFWLGNNDVLGFATSGGVSPTSPTSAVAFSALYVQAFDSLRAALPTARILVGNVFDVWTIPFFTTLGPKIAPSLAAVGAPLRYQKHGETGLATGSSTLTEATPPLICLTGSAYASLIGQRTGRWYRDKGYPALPPGIDTTQPFGVHPQNPWPDALVLDTDEQTTAATASSAFNQTIATVAQSKGAVVVDFNSFLREVKANGYYWAGQKYTADYISGGLFSLDGVHPSSRGAGVMANRFLKAMNGSFGMSVSYVDLFSIPGIPAPVAKTADGLPVIPPDAFKELEMLWGSR
jgi:lysophospholipase L1-like esterase